MFTSLTSLVFGIMGRHHFDDVQWLLLPSLLFSSLLFAIAYLGHLPLFSYADLVRDIQPSDEKPVQPEVTEQPNEEPSPEEENEADAERSTVERVAEDIRKLMEGEKTYLKHDLRVNEVAQMLGTNAKYVSLAVNTHFGCTFSEYINDLRIAYARQLMKEQPKLTITDVAHRSGYTSMASFYRNLKSRSTE